MRLERLHLGRGELAAELLDNLGGRLRLVVALELAGAERLAPLAVVAVDGDRLEAQLPALVIDLLDLFDGRRLRHVDGLADRPGEKRLDRGHHPDVAHREDGADAVARLEGAFEYGEVLRLESGGALDRLALVDVGDDLLGLVRRVAQLAKGAPSLK